MLGFFVIAAFSTWPVLIRRTPVVERFDCEQMLRIRDLDVTKGHA